MSETIKIILVDDHQIILDGIANMLKDTADITVVRCASGVCKAIDLIRDEMPDVVITDLSMPGRPGMDLIRHISREYPSIGIIVLSMFTTEDYILSAIKAGARGYLPKQETTRTELINAIRRVHQGEEYYSDAIAQVITRMYTHHAKSSGASRETIGRQFTLTARETEILRMYAEGLSNQEIAEALHISVRTVETHKNNIMQKYQFRSTVDMVKFAIRNRMTEL